MDLIFLRGTEAVSVRVIARQLYFAKAQGGYVKYAPLQGLQLNPAGILKEFPDLKGKSIKQIKKIAIERLKEHIKKMKSPTEIRNYLKEDLKKHGYKMIGYQIKGHRYRKVK